MTLTREYEIDYLRKHGFEADYKKMEYSINKGLWGTSIGGKETLPFGTDAARGGLSQPDHGPRRRAAEDHLRRGRAGGGERQALRG